MVKKALYRPDTAEGDAEAELPANVLNDGPGAGMGWLIDVSIHSFFGLCTAATKTAPNIKPAIIPKYTISGSLLLFTHHHLPSHFVACKDV
jgi:hypothetical protein